MDRGAGPRSGLVGREAELALLEQHLSETAAGHPSLVLLEGAPGVGKTAIWRAGVREAERHGIRVLTCRPVSGETRLSFAALADLLGDRLPDVAPSLPAPQRRALEIALLLAEPGDDEVEQRTVSAATFSALRALGADGPVVIAIDDVQWLDEPSANALAYALRRLDDQPVAFLGCVRVEAQRGEPTALEGALERRDDAALRRIHVGPLSVSELHVVIRDRLGVSFTHDVLSRLHAASGGNPLHALELARALGHRSGPPPPGGPLPVPETLRGAVSAGLDRLSPEARDLAVVAAALSSPTLDLVRAAGVDGAVDEAVGAGVLELDGDGRLLFAHPLLASTAYADLGPRAQRELHARLAELVTGEERARHLALAADGPSADIAAAVQGAARAAAERGATGTAAALAANAVRLTPPDDTASLTERSLDAAAYETRNGDWSAAKARMEAVLPTLPEGDARAAVLLRLARIVDTAQHLALSRQAIAEAAHAPLRAEAHRLAAEGAMMSGDVPRALADARAAVEVAERADDGDLLVECLGTLCHYETFTASVTAGTLERAVSLEQERRRPSGNYSPRTILGLRLMYADRLDEARTLLEASYKTATELGDEYDRMWLLGQLAQLECRAGQLGRADAHAHETAVTTEQIGSMDMVSAFVTAHVGAHLGRVDEARATASRGAALATDEGYELYRILNLWALGFLELSLGDPQAADRCLRDLPEAVEAMGYRNPGVRPVYADSIEARIACGDDGVEPLVDELERRGRELDYPWARATGARCRGLLLAAHGMHDAGTRELGRALREHDDCPQPLERGRTLLALGTVERRSKRRAAARDALTRSLELFDALGAPLWAGRAAAELQRLPGRRPTGASGLTDTERAIAELVAGGLSNKEVAARLFVTVRTVEANLTKVYAKLGVRSRTELAARLRS